MTDKQKENFVAVATVIAVGLTALAIGKVAKRITMARMAIEFNKRVDEMAKAALNK